MVRRLWRAAGDTRVTFWSLAASAILFFTGSLYANLHFELFGGLNETRIQDWAAANMAANLPRAWWLPLLLLALLVLGVNTLSCTVQRLCALLPARGQMRPAEFARELTPTIIHALFGVVMIGHLVTITGGEWRRFPLREGAEIPLGTNAAPLKIVSVEDELFPMIEGQPRRIAQTRVRLSSPTGERFELGHGDPLSYHGLHLILDREKKRRPSREKTEENCNREKDYRLDRKAPATGPTLLVVSDPGVKVILPAFILILVLMGWYFAGRRTGRQGH
jgi:hypothetical protein